jgi:hypothetical protein
MMTMDSERRKHPRFSVGGTAAVYLADGRPFAFTKLRNISTSGCYVDTPFPLAIGTAIEMTITLDGTGSSLTAKGTVRTFDRKAGMGVEFGEEAFEALGRLLQQNSKTHPPQ